MPLATIRQIYLLPLTSEHLHRATAAVEALGLTYELLPEASDSRGTTTRLAVGVPTILVVHYYDFSAKRSELWSQAHKLVPRPTHAIVRGWVSGEDLPAIYPPVFFAQSTERDLALAAAELVVREHIIQEFAGQGIKVRKISFNKPIAEILGDARLFSGQEAYALVEEARLLLPKLAEILGAYTEIA